MLGFGGGMEDIIRSGGGLHEGTYVNALKQTTPCILSLQS
jgi:hypothetical protein